jgi:hypothetical protein
MCSVSAVSDYYMRQWPQRFPDNPNPFSAADENADLRRDIKKALELLDSIDKRLKDVECNDPQKAAFLGAVGYRATDGTGI